VATPEGSEGGEEDEEDEDEEEADVEYPIIAAG